VLWILVILLFCPPLKAASFRSELLDQGSTLQLSFVLKSASRIPSSTGLSAPDFKGFRVVGGPSISSSTNIVNSRVSHERRWTYQLLRVQAGDLVIGPASARMDGETYSTAPRKVKASAGSADPGRKTATAGEVHLRAVVDNSRPVVGEPVHLRFKLYFNTQIERYEPPRLERAGGFLIEKFPEIRQPEVRQEEWRGNTWNSAVLLELALFPTRAGEITLEPVTCSVSVVDQDSRRNRRRRDPFADFFDSSIFGQRTKSLTLASRPLKLEVQPLPPGAPEGFSGAVGNFKLRAGPDREELDAGEALTFSATVSGSGNIRLLPEPELELSPDFERYDTQVEQSLKASQGAVRGSRTFKTLLVPRAPGEQKIDTLRFVYYDPRRGKYVVRRAGPWAVRVLRGEDYLPGGGGPLLLGAERVRSYGSDIRHILDPPARLDPETRPLAAQPAWRVALLLVWVLPLAAWAHSRRRERLAADSPELRRRRALSRALRVLKALRGKQDAGEAPTREQCAALAKLLERYLADQLNRAPAGLVLEQALEELAAAGVSRETLDRAGELGRRLDQALYGRGAAGKLPAREMKAVLETLDRELKEVQR